MLSLQSAEAEGSTFTLTLLAAAARASLVMPSGAKRTQALPKLRSAGCGGSRILLVDDHPLNRRVGRLFLEPQGYHITEAENGQQALDKLADS